MRSALMKEQASSISTLLAKATRREQLPSFTQRPIPQVCRVVPLQTAKRLSVAITARLLENTVRHWRTTKTFTIPIVDDVLVDGNETFTVNLSSPTGALLGVQ